MDAPVIGKLAVPGALVRYEVRGSGPLLLLLCGGNSDAAVFEPLAGILSAAYRVVSFDPRGNSRSPLAGPPVDQHIEVHADDAHRLLQRLNPAGGPVSVFGSCSGGLIALELAVRHPEDVGSLIVHEPPCFGLLPDAADRLAFFDAVYATFRREGIPAATTQFSALFGDRPAPVLPEAHDNTAFFLAHVVRPFTCFVPDLGALVPSAAHITVGGGLSSRTQDIHRPTPALAAHLGRPVLDFPGGHVGYAKYPGEFARLITGALAATARPAHVRT